MCIIALSAGSNDTLTVVEKTTLVESSWHQRQFFFEH